MVIQAINQEVQRGGQVYYIHNRVKTILGSRPVEKILPEYASRLVTGKWMDELELVMSVISGNIDVLISTTIIESGLVPNANTIIIEREPFRSGRTSVRGRVGRWNRQAYAHLLLPKNGILTDDARKRIAAIRRYSHLSRIPSYRDLKFAVPVICQLRTRRAYQQYRV